MYVWRLGEVPEEGQNADEERSRKRCDWRHLRMHGKSVVASMRDVFESQISAATLDRDL